MFYVPLAANGKRKNPWVQKEGNSLGELNLGLKGQLATHVKQSVSPVQETDGHPVQKNPPPTQWEACWATEAAKMVEGTKSVNTHSARMTAG